jgi:hypothetical protein
LVSALTFPKATLCTHALPGVRCGTELTVVLDDLRSCCDLMHTFFTLDEHTDPLDAAGAKALCDATMDAIENPDKPRPEGEAVIGEIARQ